MNNLPTPLYDPILPDPETRQLLDFWEIELEKLCSRHILDWALETFGTQIGLALSGTGRDAVVCSLMEGHPFQLPMVDWIQDLLLHEKWTSPEPEEMLRQTFDGRSASAELWARFHVEHLCKKNEKRIRSCRAWIVPATRYENPVLDKLPILSWIERFGVVRIAPLARWRVEDVQEKIRRESTPFDECDFEPALEEGVFALS